MIELQKINEYISFLPAVEDPLSADVAVIPTKAGTFFFDVGANDEAYHLIKNTEGPKHVIISHFHQDHTGNLQRLLDEKILTPSEESGLPNGSQTFNSPETDTLTLGSFTYKRYNKGTNLRSLVELSTKTMSGKSISIQIGPLPNSHAKGSLYLMVNNDYVFLGDGTYWNIRPDRKVYNTQVLKQEIDILKTLPASKAVLSHEMGNVRELSRVINRLERIYALRRGNETEIDLTVLEAFGGHGRKSNPMDMD